jgi:ADP-heptose:LPS heptosyltransferase
MEIKNRNLFRLTRFILFKAPPLFRFLAKLRPVKKRLLIIKTDAIGDYVLFRNFLEVVRASAMYDGYEIDLLGNTVYRDLALNYDAAFINSFIFIKPYDLYEAPLQTLKLGWRLFKRNYQQVLQPAYTRMLITDGLAALSAAKQITGFTGDTEGIQEKYKRRTDKFYTCLLNLPPNIYFEFYRTKFFFEEVLKKSIPLPAPHIVTAPQPKNHIVIFAGAGTAKRSWEREKFLALIKLIIKHTGRSVFLAGGVDAIYTCNYLTGNLPAGAITNLTGQTTLPQLVQLISGAALVISNETSAVHIAAAVQTPWVCVLGGGHFGRFAPYPAYSNNPGLCVYDKMECYNCNWNCRFETLPTEPYPCISIINVEQVWRACLEYLPTFRIHQRFAPNGAKKGSF